MRRFILFCLLSSACLASAQQPQNPCDAPQARQMDFWLGDWDLTWDGGRGVNKITRVLDGCVLQEDFRAVEGTNLVGRSVSAWDPNAGVWKQTWVDNNGSYLDFTGVRGDGAMTLRRQFQRAGKEIHQRMVFRDIAEDSFTWEWQSSTDGGQTWTTAWQIHYRRR